MLEYSCTLTIDDFVPEAGFAPVRPLFPDWRRASGSKPDVSADSTTPAQKISMAGLGGSRCAIRDTAQPLSFRDVPPSKTYGLNFQLRKLATSLRLVVEAAFYVPPSWAITPAHILVAV